MDSQEKKEVEGGHPFLVILAVACVFSFTVGVYNGYKDEEAKNKSTIVKIQ